MDPSLRWGDELEMSDFKTLDDLPEELTGKRVLVRVDLNVPMDGAQGHRRYPAPRDAADRRSN